MSVREITVSRLVGRRLLDSAGRSVGRIEELVCEIELHAHGREYVVRELHVGTFGRFEALAGSAFSRSILRLAGLSGRVGRHRVPWEWLDLHDPDRPRLTRRREELPAVE